MANKVYSAQKMREYADAIAGDLNDSGMTSVTCTFDDLLPVIQCLRQAADMVERCEKRLQELRPYRDEDIINEINYILRGDAGKGEK